MGIRVHKMIGYGTDTVTKGDSRFDRKALRDFLNEEKDGKEFFQFIKSHKDDILQAAISEEGDLESAEWAYKFMLDWGKKDPYKGFSSYQSVEYDDEFGLKNVMVLVPPAMVKNWSRYNDSIDWSEETHSHGQKARHQFLNESLYPYDFKFALIRGAREFTVDEIKEYSDMGGKALQRYDAKVITSDLRNRISYARDTKFRDEFMASYRPALPIELVAFMLWTGAFTDLDAMKDSLRPMLYVYWS